jgi:ABC-type polar amino acid transport system ATPase subunit
MLFDEPTSALDHEMVKGVLDTMVSLAADGMTIRKQEAECLQEALEDNHAHRHAKE